jgi:hypothetical protein
MIRYWKRRKPYTWKAVSGFTMLTALLIFTGMQIQAWRDASERERLIAASQSTIATCERRIVAVRDLYSRQAEERASVVEEVKYLADQTLTIQKETLAMLKSRAPLTDKIARQVEEIDNKATEAAAESKAAKVEARRAVRAAEVGTAASRAAAVAAREK